MTRDHRLGGLREGRHPRRHIIEAELRSARKPAIQLVIDFGAAIGTRKCSAQLTVHYTPEALIGRQVAAVMNFRRARSASSVEVLTLGFPDENGGWC